MIDINERLLSAGMRKALEAAALVAVNEAAKIAPRHLERLPQNIDRKDGKAPRRKRKAPVMIFGHWYEGVTGKLEDSIAHQMIGQDAYVGVKAHGPASKYAKAQELGTPRIPPRPFLSNTLKDPIVKAKMRAEAQGAFDLFLSQF